MNITDGPGKFEKFNAVFIGDFSPCDYHVGLCKVWALACA